MVYGVFTCPERAEVLRFQRKAAPNRFTPAGLLIWQRSSRAGFCPDWRAPSVRGHSTRRSNRPNGLTKMRARPGLSPTAAAVIHTAEDDRLSIAPVPQ